MTRQRRIREEVLAGDIILVRGDVMHDAVLREDAVRTFLAYGSYGVSAFAATERGVDWVAEHRLVRFHRLTLMLAGDLRQSGIKLVPTGRSPHYTLEMGDLEDGVARLVACPQRLLMNRYHGTTRE
ncbi:MAG: hypothetical protein ACRD0Q_03020 [Acidimicrobiales bacterium]